MNGRPLPILPGNRRSSEKESNNDTLRVFYYASASVIGTSDSRQDRLTNNRSNEPHLSCVEESPNICQHFPLRGALRKRRNSPTQHVAPRNTIVGSKSYRLSSRWLRPLTTFPPPLER